MKCARRKDNAFSKRSTHGVDNAFSKRSMHGVDNAFSKRSMHSGNEIRRQTYGKFLSNESSVRKDVTERLKKFDENYRKKQNNLL